METEEEIMCYTGEEVIIIDCEARRHGDNDGCLCDLIGQTVKISGLYQTSIAGTPSYHIECSTKRARTREFLERELWDDLEWRAILFPDGLPQRLEKALREQSPKFNMENKTEPLEGKLEKIDWKEWIPIYGVFQAWKDTGESKPSFLYPHRELIFNGSAAYHGISALLIFAGLYNLAEKLF